MTVAIEATNTNLAALLERIDLGDHVQLQRNGQAVATISPISTDQHPPKLERTPEQIAAASAALARADERSKRLGLKFDMVEFTADKEFGRR
jgi:antitoxin (DNA-binding transcriptional repressor) of toxin-antitoxin stability system